MARTATTRYGLRAAPAGLALVQDLLNTRGLPQYAEAVDLLADLASAQAWLDGALDDWATTHDATAATMELTAPDVARLQALRGTFERLVDAAHDDTVAPPALPLGSLTVTVDEAGRTRLTPAGSGMRWLTSALLAELHEAQASSTWPRLKRCANEVCGTAFYDGSRNSSGVWHDVRTCGNAANVRAHRARQRAASSD
jgi:predicted RNA-binding Zn ribbon-like protein